MLLALRAVLVVEIDEVLADVPSCRRFVCLGNKPGSDKYFNAVDEMVFVAATCSDKLCTKKTDGVVQDGRSARCRSSLRASMWCRASKTKRSCGANAVAWCANSERDGTYDCTLLLETHLLPW